MKKSDLRSGMIIKQRGGAIGMVLLNTPNGDVIANDGTSGDTRTWSPVENYDEYLKYKDPIYKKNDIVEVYGYSCNKDGARVSADGRKLLWRSEELQPVVLTKDYSAEFDSENSILRVGCQNIPFEKVLEVAEKIKSLKK